MNNIPDIHIPPMIPLDKLNEDATFVVGVTGPFAGMAFNCDRRLVFGRSTNCNIVLPTSASRVSKVHCELIPTTDGIVLKDLRSSNGTYLGNGRSVQSGQQVILKKGDTFCLADKEVMFRIQ